MRSRILHSATWAVAAATLLVSSPAAAFRMIQNNTVGTVSAGAMVTCNDAGGFTHWGTLSINWSLNTANQGLGKSTSVRNALESWNDVTTAGYVLNYLGSTNNGFATDGVNTINWNTDGSCTGTCLAITALTLQAGQVIVESDILMRNDRTWTTNGGDFDTEAVLAHELGHSLGIHHTELTTTPRPTMFATYFGIDERSLHTDDQQAIACSYTRYHPCTGAPATPSYITGPHHDLCQSATEVYMTPHVPGADGYRWEIVGQGWARNTANNEVSISGTYFSPGAYTLRVQANNACGSSGWYSATIFVLANSDPACGSCTGKACP